MASRHTPTSHGSPSGTPLSTRSCVAIGSTSRPVTSVELLPVLLEPAVNEVRRRHRDRRHSRVRASWIGTQRMPVVEGFHSMAIFCVNQSDVDWSNYEGSDGPSAIRFKALTRDAVGVPGVQFIEYGPVETDPVHQHDVGEFFIVMSGEMWLD